MRISTCLVVLLLVLLATAMSSAQTRNNLKVTVRSQKPVLVRTGKIVRDFPDKKKATITQPIFSGLTPPVLKQLRATLALKNIFGSTLTQYRGDTWLEEFSYEVNFNHQGILDISYTQSGSGAYPDQQTKHFVIDLTTGQTITASQVFVSSQLGKLAALVDSKLQAEIRQILSETGDDGKSA